jgi:hypothetical protein
VKRRDWWLLLFAQLALYIAETSAGARVDGPWAGVLDAAFMVVLGGSLALAVVLWVRALRATRTATDEARSHRATYVSRSRRG